MTAQRFIVVGDEAWLPEEYEAEQRRIEQRRAYDQSPERKARRQEYQRLWREQNRERIRAYKREWNRNHRPTVVGSLHALACKGPTKATGCVCRKIKVYGRRLP